MWTWAKVGEVYIVSKCPGFCFAYLDRKFAVLISEYVSQPMRLIPVILTVMKLLGKVVL